MKTEAQLNHDMQTAERARQLVNDPMIVRALQTMRETCYYNIARSAFDQTEERENLYHLLKACELFEKQFIELMRSGQKAKARLEK